MIDSTHGAIRLAVACFALSVGCAAICASAQEPTTPSPSAKRMLDGNRWTTANVNVEIDESYCYDNADSNCRRFGRLYTWSAAQRVCGSLGEGWRLPTNDDWQRLAKPYGGVRDDSSDTGKAAFTALIAGGRSGMNLVLSGGREVNGEYARLDAHGLYWTASETDATHAWCYNVGRGMRILNRHPEVEKARALAVRCVNGSGSASR